MLRTKGLGSVFANPEKLTRVITKLCSIWLDEETALRWIEALAARSLIEMVESAHVQCYVLTQQAAVCLEEALKQLSPQEEIAMPLFPKEAWADDLTNPRRSVGQLWCEVA